MTVPVLIFLVAVVVPVFFGKSRSAPFWLAAQGAALAWNIGVRDALSVHTVVALVEVLLLRTVVAPLAIRHTIQRRLEPNLDLMPSNLFAWAIGVALVVLAFQFAAPARTDRQALTLGVVGATVAVSLLLLSTNESPPAQFVAVLFMENGLALFESLQPEPWPVPVHGSLMLVSLLTVTVGTWLIATPDPTSAAPLRGQP